MRAAHFDIQFVCFSPKTLPLQRDRQG